MCQLDLVLFSHPLVVKNDAELMIACLRTRLVHSLIIRDWMPYEFDLAPSDAQILKSISPRPERLLLYSRRRRVRPSPRVHPDTALRRRAIVPSTEQGSKRHTARTSCAASTTIGTATNVLMDGATRSTRCRSSEGSCTTHTRGSSTSTTFAPVVLSCNDISSIALLYPLCSRILRQARAAGIFINASIYTTAHHQVHRFHQVLTRCDGLWHSFTQRNRDGGGRVGDLQ